MTVTNTRLFSKARSLEDVNTNICFVKKKKNPSVQCHVMKKPTVIHGFPPTQKKCSQEIFPGASLMAQMVKNLPAMQDTGVQSLGGEDPLGEGNGNLS